MKQLLPAYMIRDGLLTDIERCMGLSHSYETDNVWQMSIRQEMSSWQISFRAEHLPRTVQAMHEPAASRLQRAYNQPESCFLVAVEKDGDTLLGYLSLRTEAAYGAAFIQDVVVEYPFRRQGVGTRLLNIAERWATELGLRRMFFETETHNYPSILFAQQRGYNLCGFNDQAYPNNNIAVYFGKPIR